MTISDIGTQLSDFRVDGHALFRAGSQIAVFETPIRELARLGDRLFIIVDPTNSNRDPVYAGANMFCLDLVGTLLWRAPNLNTRDGWYPMCYSGLRIFDTSSPKLQVRIDDRGSRYFDPYSGVQLTVTPRYDWSDYPTAWKQSNEDQDRITRSVFASAITFYPKPG